MKTESIYKAINYNNLEKLECDECGNFICMVYALDLEGNHFFCERCAKPDQEAQEKPRCCDDCRLPVFGKNVEPGYSICKDITCLCHQNEKQENKCECGLEVAHSHGNGGLKNVILVKSPEKPCGALLHGSEFEECVCKPPEKPQQPDRIEQALLKLAECIDNLENINNRSPQFRTRKLLIEEILSLTHKD